VGRILWCGGSHLGHAKKSILREHTLALADFTPEFAVTAGPKVREWSARGGRYEVRGTSVRRPSDPYRSNPGEFVDLSSYVDLSPYAAIVLIGQYIQPWRIQTSGFDWDQPMSPALLGEAIEDKIVNLPFVTRASKGILYNEPLVLFPRLTTSVVLFPDPARFEGGVASQNFDDALTSVCERNRVVLCRQHPSTLTPCRHTTPKYRRDGRDDFHVSRAFWQFNLSEVIVPLVRQAAV
jgi:hypothetical protein